MDGGLDKLVAPGRHTRRPGRPGLRRVSLATLIMLVVQYGLGIFLNLYVAVPASDAHAGIFTEIATAPLALTVHALLGLALIGTAILLVVRAVSVGDRLIAMLASAGLTAIGGAFGAGEIFVRNGHAGRVAGDGHPDRGGAAVLRRHPGSGHRGPAGRDRVEVAGRAGQAAASGPHRPERAGQVDAGDRDRAQRSGRQLRRDGQRTESARWASR